MVVAIVLSSLKFGGAERVALNLANALADEGVQVDFLLMSKEGEFLHEAMARFRVIDLNCDRTWKLPAKLASYLRATRPTALLSSFWKLNLCACMARISSPRTKLLLWEHSQPSQSSNSPIWLYAITASVAYRMSTRVIAVSSGVRDDVLSCTVGLGSKLQVIFNAIPPPGKLPSDVIDARDGRHVIWAGRLDAPKNPGLALEAFALLAAKRDVALCFVGDGALRPALAARCQELGLGGKVMFMGFQQNPYSVMQRSDVLVLSSDREGLGNVMIEALYCGLGVVSTDCGTGVQDVLQNGAYGRTVPIGDEVALAKALEQELDSRRDVDAQVHGAQRFRPEVIASEFLAVLRG